MIKLINNNKEGIELLSIFLENAGASLKTFRYFKLRPLKVIGNHFATILILNDNALPVAYGHLDPENEKMWLGICVAEYEMGKGYGNEMMKLLVLHAKQLGIKELFLKVDSDNTRAISMYRKFFFEITTEVSNNFLIMKRSV